MARSLSLGQKATKATRKLRCFYIILKPRCMSPQKSRDEVIPHEMNEIWVDTFSLPKRVEDLALFVPWVITVVARCARKYGTGTCPVTVITLRYIRSQVSSAFTGSGEH
jgi:hypothetical protein